MSEGAASDLARVLGGVTYLQDYQFIFEDVRGRVELLAAADGCRAFRVRLHLREGRLARIRAQRIVTMETGEERAI